MGPSPMGRSPTSGSLGQRPLWQKNLPVVSENSCEPLGAEIRLESQVPRNTLMAISAELYRDVRKAATLGRLQHVSIPFPDRSYAARW